MQYDRQVTHRKLAWLRGLIRPSFGAAVVVLVSGLVLFVLGLADVPLPWLVAGTGLLIVVTLLAGRTLESGTSSREKVRLLWGAVAGLMAFIVGAWVYSSWFDPSKAEHMYMLVLANADETQCVRVSGEPGGQEIYLDQANHGLAPLCGGNSYPFECKVSLPNETEWIRLAGGRYWAPLALFRPISGAGRVDMRRCDE